MPEVGRASAFTCCPNSYSNHQWHAICPYSFSAHRPIHLHLIFLNTHIGIIRRRDAVRLHWHACVHGAACKPRGRCFFKPRCARLHQNFFSIQCHAPRYGKNVFCSPRKKESGGVGKKRGVDDPKERLKEHLHMAVVMQTVLKREHNHQCPAIHLPIFTEPVVTPKIERRCAYNSTGAVVVQGVTWQGVTLRTTSGAETLPLTTLPIVGVYEPVAMLNLRVIVS